MSDKWRPDWKNESQYPNPANASFRRWAWEFLRRNEEYQTDWSSAKIDPPGLFAIASADFLVNPPDDDKPIDEEARHYWELCQKYRVRTLIDPAGEWPDDEADEPFWHELPLLPFHPGPGFWESGQGYLRPRTDSEVVIKFNVQQPIDQQLDSAREIVRRLKQSLGQQGFPKPREKTFSLCLRLLDAKHAGASWDVIAKVLAPGKDNEYVCVR